MKAALLAAHSLIAAIQLRFGAASLPELGTGLRKAAVRAVNLCIWVGRLGIRAVLSCHFDDISRVNAIAAVLKKDNG
jgi:hypothetical protein